MDDFNIITEEDKNHIAYTACMGGTALIGTAVGSFVPVLGTLAGGATGFAIGLLTCKHLQTPIKRKFLSSNSRLSEHEILAALRELRRQKPALFKKDAIGLLAGIRHEIHQNPSKYQKLA